MKFLSTREIILLELSKMKDMKRLVSFYGTAIAKRVNLSIHEVESHLASLVETRVLDREYEYNCPSCYRTLSAHTNLNEFTHDEEDDCSFCGEELEPATETNTNIRFNFPKNFA